MGPPGTYILPLRKPEERSQQQQGEMGVAPCPSLGALEGTRWKSCPEAKSHPSAGSHFHRDLRKSLSPSWPRPIIRCPLSLFVRTLAFSGRRRENSSACRFISQHPAPHPRPSTEGRVLDPLLTGKVGSSQGPVAERGPGSTKGAVAIPDDRV